MLAAAAAGVLCLPLASQAGLPTPWAPANAGVMWWQPNDPGFSLPRQPPGEPSGAWYLTRRVGIHPTMPELMHLGSFFHGLYVSTGGGGWANVTPGCLLPIEPPASVPPENHDAYRFTRRTMIAATGLNGCAIEGIAYDPVIPTRMYVAAYDVVRLSGVEPVLGDAGVYVSDDRGLSWRQMVAGLRGNGLAVSRPVGSLSATIVAGFIQASNASVGPTPNNGSLVVSRDDGFSWDTITLPPSGCSDAPGTSQRVTPTVVIDPVDPSRIYAGTNAGLYTSRDAGRTWALTKLACGGVWGVVVSADGRFVYIGDKDGVISRAPSDTLTFSPLVDLGDGKVQSLLLDPRDQRTLYAAMWSGRDANVFRVPITGSGVTRLDDSWLREIVPLDRSWPSGVPKPFPLAFKDANAAPAPSLFLAQRAPLPNPMPAPLWGSTIFRGVFVRTD